MPSGTRPLPGPLSLEVAALLSEALRSRGVPQSAVAAAADMSASQLSRTLSGQKVFTLDQLDAVCTALGVDVTAVISEADSTVRSRRRRDNVVALRPNVGTPTQTDLEKVELNITELAASTDNTPINPDREP